MRFRALLAACFVPLALAGCALQPMYAGGTAGAAGQALANVSVAPIQGRAGWLVANELRDRLSVGQSGGGVDDDSARYRLEVRLDDQLEGFGLLNDDTIGRERRTLRARYQLIDTADDSIVLDATAGSDVGIDVVSSEYAVIAAEQTALERLAGEVADRVVTRIALLGRESQ